MVECNISVVSVSSDDHRLTIIDNAPRCGTVMRRALNYLLGVYAYFDDHSISSDQLMVLCIQSGIALS